MCKVVELSAAQLAVVDAPWEGTVSMVLATAGSGKTLTLTRRAVRIARELVEQKVLYARILCVCFNKGAADEMAERLTSQLITQGFEKQVEVTRNGATLRDGVTIEVRTFHALGYWVLRTSSTEEREFVGLRSGAIKLLSGKEHIDLVLNVLREGGQVKSNINKAKEAQARACARSKLREFMETKRIANDAVCEQRFTSLVQSQPSERSHTQAPAGYELYEDKMQQGNFIDYNDMICKATILITQSRRVQDQLGLRYRAVLVDEFQDMSPSDFMLCKSLVEKSKSLTVVGDDDQQIYSFRSSSTWFCHEVIQVVFGDILTLFPLNENRRCPGFVVKSADALISNNSRRVSKSLTATQADGSPVRIVGCAGENLETLFVIRRIKQLLPIVSNSGEQILILFRTNRLLVKFQEAMKSAGISTSRALGAERKAEPVGLKTFVSFALISLMVRKINITTFLWAATTVSAGLQRETLRQILETEKSTNKEAEHAIAASTTENGGVRRVARAEAEGYLKQAASTKVEDEAERGGSKPFPSEFLDKVRRWYDKKKAESAEFELGSSYEFVHVLLARSEKLMFQMRKARKMEHLVSIAVKIVCSEGGGEFDAFCEETGSQSDHQSEPVHDEALAGLDLLLKAAKKQDRDQDMAEARSTDINGTGLGADGSDDDFATMFSKDAQTRACKRSRTQGRTSIVKAELSTAKSNELLAKNLEGLWKSIHAILAVSNDPESRKASYPNRKLTVLSTIHRAKGSQFAFVFLCGADKNNIPNGIAISEHGHSSDILSAWSAVAQSSSVQEERRMLFVSMTRAQREFVCTYAGRQGSDRSLFLSELLEGVRDDARCVQEFFIAAQENIPHVLAELR